MSNIVNVLAIICERLLRLASDDGQLRRELRTLAQELLTALDQFDHVDDSQCEPVETEVTAAISTEVTDAVVALPTSVIPEPASEAPTEPPKLTLGQVSPPLEVTEPSRPSQPTISTEADLQLIEKRCRLKAEGARWAATRQRLISEAADYETEVAPKDRDIISRAKALPDCFLWMNHSTAPLPTELRLYDDVADCFDTLADAVSLVRKVRNDVELYQGEFEQSLDLLAEAQSALRTAVGLIDGPMDADQVQIFAWLKATTSENQIFIQRFMRADDPASPENSDALSARIEEADSRLEEIHKQSKKRRKLLGKVRHKLGLLDDDPDAAEAHWEILIATVDELIGDGMPPSNRELRELLLPHVDDMPDLADVPQNFELVLREIDRYLAAYPTSGIKPVSRTTPEVQDTARLLKGRSMLLIGGDRRPGAERAIQDAFNLRELIWIETREHQSIDAFESYIARPEVAVVLLAIRWTSHSFGEVKRFCDQHGKPLVRLPAGYNPNQVATQIMSQCSERLRNSDEL